MPGFGLIRLTRVTLGAFVGGAMVWAGLVACGASSLGPGLALLAAGQLMFMWLINDELCPGASAQVVLGLKLMAALVFWAALGLWVWQWWSHGPFR